MAKRIRLKHWHDPSAYDDLTAGGLMEKGLGRNEYELSDSDAMDQAKRVDANRECIARLVDELHEAGVLDAYAVARIAGVDQTDVSEAPE